MKRKEYISRFYANNKASFAIAVITTLLTAAVNLWMAWIMQQIIDSVSGAENSLDLGTLAWCVLAVVAVILLLSALRYFSKPHFMEKAMRQYKNHAFYRLTQKSISAFNSENTANYISAFSNDAATVESGYLDVQFELLSNAVLLFGAMLMMIMYSPLMTLIACAFFALPIAVSYFTGNRMEKAERRISEKNSELVATLKDALSGFAVIKSFKAENEISEQFRQRNAAVEGAKCHRRKLSEVIGALSGVAAITAQLGTFLVGAYLALSDRGMTAGVLIVFIDLTGLAITPIRMLPQQLAQRKAANALVDKLAASMQNSIRDEGENIKNELSLGVTLKNVSFGYEAESIVLHDISFNFKAGKKYAVVGASGSGKSTLLNLLMAAHGDYSGEIRYDEHEIKSVSSSSLYDMVSMIGQNVFVFNASIRDNITMFREFPKAEVESAIALSGLNALISERGEDYLCGENGSGLSGGEKQRISIARSLLKKSKLLLCDEATAALDAETAYQVSSAILNLSGVTGIVVTHSLDENLLRRYDGIIAMKNGQIIESGTFDELIAQKGYFYSLFTLTKS